MSSNNNTYLKAVIPLEPHYRDYLESQAASSLHKPLSEELNLFAKMRIERVQDEQLKEFYRSSKTRMDIYWPHKKEGIAPRRIELGRDFVFAILQFIKARFFHDLVSYIDLHRALNMPMEKAVHNCMMYLNVEHSYGLENVRKSYYRIKEGTIKVKNPRILFTPTKQELKDNGN